MQCPYNAILPTADWFRRFRQSFSAAMMAGLRRATQTPCCESKASKHKEILVRRLLVIGALGAAIFAAFAVGSNSDSVMAGSNGSLILRASTPVSGCPLASMFSFCGQLQGGSTEPAQFTLTASGPVTGLAIKFAAVAGSPASQFAAFDFTVESTTCGASLAANASCTINVSFTPVTTTKGTRAAALTVTDAGHDTALINLTGTSLNNTTGGATALGFATPPAPACPQDNAFTFCSQAVHTASGTQNFLLTAGNTATGLTFAFAAVPGLPSEFALSDFTIASNACGSTLTTGASCAVGVQFTPTTTGARAAILKATDAAGDSTLIYLAGSTSSGLSITPSGQAPACSTGNTFEFCNTPTGGSDGATAFTLTNTSGTQVTGITVPTTSVGGDFTVPNTSCLTVLAAGASCGINVKFSPATTGLLQEPLVVTDADGDTATANLAGTGDTYSLQLAAMQPVEVSVAQGGTAAFMGQVVPDSVFGQDGEQVTFACPSTASLPIDTSCVVTPCPAAITPGTPTNFTATFVTSSKTSVAPVPPTGCSSYGPPPAGAFLVPSTRSPEPPPGARRFLWRFVWNFPGGVSLALLGALALGMFAAASRRRKHQTIFASAALVAALLTGCHHGSTAASPATPTGTTAINIQGIALDANGNSLNTSRVIQGTNASGFILDVITGK
jgi:hypothetical protein